MFHTPPYTGLPTGSALGSIEVDGTRDVHFAGGDIADCFYRLGVPPGMENYFSLPGIAGAHIPEVAKQLRVAQHVRLVPCLRVLPMGWSWSLYIAQCVHECRIARLGIDRSLFVMDKRPGASIADDVSRVAVYVDNHMVMGHDSSDVRGKAGEITVDLDSAGLQTHEHFDDTECDFVGLHFSGTDHTIRIAWRKVWRLKLGI